MIQVEAEEVEPSDIELELEDRIDPINDANQQNNKNERVRPHNIFRNRQSM